MLYRNLLRLGYSIFGNKSILLFKKFGHETNSLGPTRVLTPKSFWLAALFFYTLAKTGFSSVDASDVNLLSL
jgi:hypothetical protein